MTTMPQIDLTLDADGVWSDLADRDVIDAGSRLQVAALADGMASGRPAVALRIDLPDGGAVIVQTSIRALNTTVRALLARYPDPEIM